MTQDTNPLKELLAPFVTQVQKDLNNWVIEADTPSTLSKAMLYCCDGGKRLRPALAMLAAKAVGGNPQDELVRRCALAVELIHVYSLVHDDLPAMDDDELRRGRATAHIKYGEAMAILVGDALQARAFGLIGESGSPLAGKLVAELAAASGANGMVGGQVADMALCEVPCGHKGLEYIHSRKTGAIITAAARMGAIASGADEKQLEAITECTKNMGIAFQIIDDLLDATGSATELGKTPGKDIEAGKVTVVSEHGLDGARELAEEFTSKACQAADSLGDNASEMTKLVQLLADRTN